VTASVRENPRWRDAATPMKKFKPERKFAQKLLPEPRRERCQCPVSDFEKFRDGGSSLMHAHLPIHVL
jgi:hypothetical protein